MNRVFVSYARDDEPWALWVHAILVATGFDVEIDKVSWNVGDDFIEKTNSALNSANIIAVILSESYFDPGRYSALEGSSAQAFLTGTKKRVVLIIIDHTVPPPLLQSRIPIYLRGLTRLDSMKSMLDSFLPLLENSDTGALRLDSFDGKIAVPFPGTGGENQSAANVLDTPDILRQIELTAKEAVTSLSRLQEAESTPHYLEQAHVDANELGRAYLHEDPVGIFQRSALLARSMKTEIERNRNPRQLRELHRTFGMTLGIASYAALDLGQASQAGQIARYALANAERSGDQYLEAWALGTLALISRFNSRDLAAVDYALKGLELDVVGTARCRLLSNAAESYANMGREQEMKTFLALSEESLDIDVPASHRAEGIFHFPPAKVPYYAASALVHLPGTRSNEEAALQAERAIELFDTGGIDVYSYNDILVARVHLARARLQADHLDGVLDALEEVLHAPMRYRTSWHVHFVGQLAAVIEARGMATSDDGRALRDAIRTYLAEMSPESSK